MVEQKRDTLIIRKFLKDKEKKMTNNPVGWFEIYVQDVARAKTFYETVFKTKLENMKTPEIDMWLFPHVMAQSGAGGALVKMAGVPSGGNSTLVYFSCVDCSEEASRVAQNGGKIFKEKFSIGEHGFISLVVDTEGNMFGLHSSK
jgi:predicted enzyme related to lactoylglutathione lyase